MGEYKDEIRCPKCNSSNIYIDKKGFGVGKAVIGGLLTGGFGLLSGFIGSNKIKATCLSCGNTFKPKDGYSNTNNQIDLKAIETEKLKEWDKRNRCEAISNLSDEELEKKFRMWDHLYKKGLISDEELTRKKADYMNLRNGNR